MRFKGLQAINIAINSRFRINFRLARSSLHFFSFFENDVDLVITINDQRDKSLIIVAIWFGLN